MLGAVESALHQSLSDLEVVIVDDGSTDRTRERLLRLYGDEPRVRVLSRDNGGCAAARNMGIAHARGDVIAFLDSDDRWQPEFLSCQLRLLDAHPDVSLVMANGHMRRPDGDRALLDEWPGWVFPGSREALLSGGWMVPSFTVVRADAARRLRFDESYRVCEDTEFMFRFHQAGLRCIWNPEPLAEYGAGRGATTDHLSADWDGLRLTLYDLYRRHSDGYPPLFTREPWASWYSELLQRYGRDAEARRHIRELGRT